MARFFFHIWTGDSYEIDAIGLDLTDSNHAYVEAYRAAQEISCEMILARKFPALYRFEVADKDGVNLFELGFAEVLGLRGEVVRSRTIMHASEGLLAMSREVEPTPGQHEMAKKGKCWDQLRGLYRYKTGRGRWWACAAADDGKYVNFTRNRYEFAGIQPAFLDLPVESRDTNTENKHAA